MLRSLEQRSKPSGRVTRELLQCEFDARWRVRDGYLLGMSRRALGYTPERIEPVWSDSEFALYRKAIADRPWGSVEPVLPPPSPSRQDLARLSQEVAVTHHATHMVDAAIIASTGIMRFEDDEEYRAAATLVADIVSAAPNADPDTVVAGAKRIAGEWPGLSVIDGLRCIQLRLRYGYPLERALRADAHPPRIPWMGP